MGTGGPRSTAPHCTGTSGPGVCQGLPSAHGHSATQTEPRPLAWCHNRLTFLVKFSHRGWEKKMSARCLGRREGGNKTWLFVFATLALAGFERQSGDCAAWRYHYRGFRLDRISRLCVEWPRAYQRDLRYKQHEYGASFCDGCWGQYAPVGDFGYGPPEREFQLGYFRGWKGPGSAF
jgi:hypothetical protein